MKTSSLLAIRARIEFLVPLLAFCPVANVIAASSTTLAISIRTLSSPYQVMYKVGAEAYAKKMAYRLSFATRDARNCLVGPFSGKSRVGYGYPDLGNDACGSANGRDCTPSLAFELI